jgi:hypothetical protein
MRELSDGAPIVESGNACIEIVESLVTRYRSKNPFPSGSVPRQSPSSQLNDANCSSVTDCGSCTTRDAVSAVAASSDVAPASGSRPQESRTTHDAMRATPAATRPIRCDLDIRPSLRLKNVVRTLAAVTTIAMNAT